MASKFKHVPNKPKSGACQNAHSIICSAHEAASSFLDIFETVRKNRKAKGNATDEEQDLLRAMLLFAAAGLDSMVKQLIVDALPNVIETEEGAAAQFKTFIARRLKDAEYVNHDLLADVLGDINPRKKLVELLVRDLTSSSLQSVEQLLRTAAHFDIASPSITKAPDKLRPIFKARNEIAHEMDIDLSARNRNRRQRAKRQMTDFTNDIFAMAEAFLSEVDARTGKKN